MSACGFASESLPQGSASEPPPVQTSQTTDSLEPSGPRSEKHYFVGASLLAHDLGRYSTHPTGETSFLSGSTFFPQISVAAYFPIQGTSWGYSPLFSFTPFAPLFTISALTHKSPEGGERTSTFELGFRGTRSTQAVDLLAGIGLLNVTVSGSGGTVSLNNGDTQTDFGIPSDSSTATNFYAELGASLKFSPLPWENAPPIRWENSILMTGPLSARRAVNFITQLSFGVF